MGVAASCDAGAAEKEFLLMQAKDLSKELKHTRTVCDSLKDELSDKKAKCERAENDKKQLKFAVKHLNTRMHEYEIMITRLQHAVKNNEIYDMYDETFSVRSNTPSTSSLPSFGNPRPKMRRGYSTDSGIQDTGSSPMNDKEIQTGGISKVTGVQCSMLNVAHLQEICAEIDAQIFSVDKIISDNKTSISILDSLFESECNGDKLTDDDKQLSSDGTSDEDDDVMGQ